MPGPDSLPEEPDPGQWSPPIGPSSHPDESSVTIPCLPVRRATASSYGAKSDASTKRSDPGDISLWMVVERDDGGLSHVRADGRADLDPAVVAKLPLTHALRCGCQVRIPSFLPSATFQRAWMQSPGMQDYLDGFFAFVPISDLTVCGASRRRLSDTHELPVAQPVSAQAAARSAPAVLWALRRVFLSLAASVPAELPVLVLGYLGSLPRLWAARDCDGPGTDVGTYLVTHFEKERWYPGRGWVGVQRPPDGGTAPEGGTWDGGWEVLESRGDSEGWQYSAGFSDFWSWRPHNTFVTWVRRRRWCRPVRYRLFEETPVVERLWRPDAPTEDYFPGSDTVRRTCDRDNFGAFRQVCEPMLGDEDGIEPRTNFTGRQAVDWLVRNWRRAGLGVVDFGGDATPQSPRPGSSPPTPRPRARNMFAHPGRARMMSPRTPGRSRESITSRAQSLRVSGVFDRAPGAEETQRRRDAVAIFEALRLTGIIAADDRKGGSDFRDDPGVICNFKTATSDPADVYRYVVDTLCPPMRWLGNVTFDSHSDWFRHVTEQVRREVGVAEEFASRHRHRWKVANHECLHCKDLLVEDSVVLLLCGHTLCTQCCRRFEKEAAGASARLSEDVREGLVICPSCHAPSSIFSREAVRVRPFGRGDGSADSPHRSVGFRETRRTRPFVFQVQEVYENQRRGFLTQYSARNLLPSDRRPYGDENGVRESAAPRSVGLPNIEWQWAESWRLSKGPNVDDEGWQYAWGWPRDGGFESTEWHPSPGMLRFVRRRRWMRVAINGPATTWVREQIDRQGAKRGVSVMQRPLGEPAEPLSPCSSGAADPPAAAAATAAAAAADDDDDGDGPDTVAALNDALSCVVSDDDWLTVLREFRGQAGEDLRQALKGSCLLAGQLAAVKGSLESRGVNWDAGQPGADEGRVRELEERARKADEARTEKEAELEEVRRELEEKARRAEEGEKEALERLRGREQDDGDEAEQLRRDCEATAERLRAAERREQETGDKLARALQRQEESAAELARAAARGAGRRGAARCGEQSGGGGGGADGAAEGRRRQSRCRRRRAARHRAQAGGGGGGGTAAPGGRGGRASRAARGRRGGARGRGGAGAGKQHRCRAAGAAGGGRAEAGGSRQRPQRRRAAGRRRRDAAAAARARSGAEGAVAAADASSGRPAD
eukprot:TRINITY_DN5111_c0_g2_i2.p1 TRINITY_DN5111_c0_g2~~TRINITY_DN5111_c0_g2_i2.p1  ORF type:complete len:1193 (+),score=324.63 TRINITY_DN5111_c0_g2_i2:65-3580(+)